MLALVVPAHAQAVDDRPRVRAFAEASALYARPLRDSRRHVDHGVGVNLSVRVPLEEEGRLDLRLDGTVINYGHESREACLSPTIGCRVQVKQITSNDILSLGVGPEPTVA